jgi:hypothetical protein
MGQSNSAYHKRKKIELWGSLQLINMNYLIHSIIDPFFNYITMTCAIGSNVNMTLTIKLKFSNVKKNIK